MLIELCRIFSRCFGAAATGCCPINKYSRFHPIAIAGPQWLVQQCALQNMKIRRYVLGFDKLWLFWLGQFAQQVPALDAVL